MCNEKCKHGLGRGLSPFNKEIIYSIRLVPGSSPGQPPFHFRLKLSSMYRKKSYSIFEIHFFYSHKIPLDIHFDWLTWPYKACYTVE